MRIGYTAFSEGKWYLDTPGKREKYLSLIMGTYVFVI